MFGSFPEMCSGRAILAGLRLEHGRRMRRTSSPIRFLRAALDETGTARLRACARRGGRAMGDARQFAASLAASRRRRNFCGYWALTIFGQSGRALMRGRLYPWSGIVGIPKSRPRASVLDEAYARARAVAQDRLAGLLDR